MKAAILTEVGKIVVAETNTPSCGRDEVLIRVKLGGICGSDHTLYHGRFNVPLPVIPGHEAIGIVEAVGEDVAGIEAGQRVTIQPNFSCGQCEQGKAWPRPSVFARLKTSGRIAAYSPHIPKAI